MENRLGRPWTVNHSSKSVYDFRQSDLSVATGLGTYTPNHTWAEAVPTPRRTTTGPVGYTPKEYAKNDEPYINLTKMLSPAKNPNGLRATRPK